MPVEVAARSVNVSRRTPTAGCANPTFVHGSSRRERTVSEARAVVLILRAAQTDWRASAWWLERPLAGTLGVETNWRR